MWLYACFIFFWLNWIASVLPETQGLSTFPWFRDHTKSICFLFRQSIISFIAFIVKLLYQTLCIPWAPFLERQGYEDHFHKSHSKAWYAVMDHENAIPWGQVMTYISLIWIIFKFIHMAEILFKMKQDSTQQPKLVPMYEAQLDSSL